MNKIVPVSMLVVSVVGFFVSLIGMITGFMAFSVRTMIAISVVFLVISCIINAVSVVQGIIFKSKICKAALIIGACAYAFVLVGFIVLFSV